MGVREHFRKPFSRYFPVRSLDPTKHDAVINYSQWVKGHRDNYDVISCPVCGSDHSEVVFKNDRYGLPLQTVLCAGCGLIYVNPAPNLETIDSFYRDGTYDAIHRASVADRPLRPPIEEPIDITRSYDGWSWYRVLMESERNFETVLEIGAGNGVNLKPFIAAGAAVTAIELSQQYAAEIEKTGASVIVDNIWALEGSFDLIVARHVVEHVTQPVELLRKLRQHLSSNGVIVVEVPGILERVPSIQTAHLVYLSEVTLQSTARLANLKVEALQTFSGGGEIIAVMSQAENEQGKVTFDNREFQRVREIISRSYPHRLRHYLAYDSPQPLRFLVSTVRKLKSR